MNTISIDYGRKFYHLLRSKKYPRAAIKRMFYDDKEKHKELGITEPQLDLIWTYLMDGRFSLNDINKKIKIPKRRKNTMRKVVQLDPVTKKVILEFESLKQAAVTLNTTPNKIIQVINGTIKKPKWVLEYKDQLAEPKSEIKVTKVTLEGLKPQEPKPTPLPVVVEASKPEIIEKPKKEEYVTPEIIVMKPKEEKELEFLVIARTQYLKALERKALERVRAIEANLIQFERELVNGLGGTVNG